MVLIPKGKGGYWGIGLVEVAQKSLTAIPKLRLNKGMDLYDSLHGFLEGQGKGTETGTIEDNMDQQLSRISHEPLFPVFLDVRKSYDLLDRGVCMEILRGYELRPNMSLLVVHYWEKQSIFPKVGKFLGQLFRMGRGVTKGDPASPIIFNIMVDKVV